MCMMAKTVPAAMQLSISATLRTMRNAPPDARSIHIRWPAASQAVAEARARSSGRGRSMW